MRRFRLSGLLALALCSLSGCSTLAPGDAPPLVSDPAPATTLTRWQQAGFTGIESYRLRSPAVSAGYALDGLTFVAFTQANWSKERVAAWAAPLPMRLAACDIALGPIELILTDRAPPMVSDQWQSDLEGFVAGLPPVTGPLVVFVDRIGTNGDIGGGAVPLIKAGTPAAVIARRSPTGKAYAPEQTLAHELGHLLGLSHVPEQTPSGSPTIDMMHPRGCLHCGFTPEQCETLRSHPLVYKIR